MKLHNKLKIYPSEPNQGQCQLALDGGKIFLAGGRELIDGSWVDLKIGLKLFTQR